MELREQRAMPVLDCLWAYGHVSERAETAWDRGESQGGGKRLGNQASGEIKSE